MLFEVSVKGGVCGMALEQSHGDFSLDVTGVVIVEAKNEALAKKKVQDVIWRDGDSVLVISDSGEGVEWEVTGARRAQRAREAYQAEMRSLKRKDEREEKKRQEKKRGRS